MCNLVEVCLVVVVGEGHDCTRVWGLLLSAGGAFCVRSEGRVVHDVV